MKSTKFFLSWFDDKIYILDSRYDMLALIRVNCDKKAFCHAMKIFSLISKVFLSSHKDFCCNLDSFFLNFLF